MAFHKTNIILLFTFLTVQVTVMADDKPLACSSSQITNAELTDFGTKIQNSLCSQNPYYFNISFDIQKLLSNVFEKYGHSPDRAFHEGFVDGITQSLDLGGMLVNDLSTGSNIRLISLRNTESESCLIFRLTGMNGINYHEYFVEKLDGNLKITDAYIYSTGQRISETIGNLYISSGFNIETDYTRSIKEIDRLRADGKYKKAFRKWNKLSYDARIEKSNLLIGISIAAKVDRNSFFSVLNLFTLFYPEEPGKYLIPMDGMIAFGLHEKALDCIDSLEGYINTDPMLDFIRANIYWQSNKPGKAAECLAQLIEDMPEFEPGYISLLDLYLEKDQFSLATELLNRMIATFQNYKEDYIPLFAKYPEFTKSPEYQSWLQQ
jgi:tetratricopeptide (TPR) repeat protein